LSKLNPGSGTYIFLLDEPFDGGQYPSLKISSSGFKSNRALINQSLFGS
jgi:hypothetical protein